jgi:hypothetical protein
MTVRYIVFLGRYSDDLKRLVLVAEVAMTHRFSASHSRQVPNLLRGVGSHESAREILRCHETKRMVK